MISAALMPAGTGTSFLDAGCELEPELELGAGLGPDLLVSFFLPLLFDEIGAPEADLNGGAV